MLERDHILETQLLVRVDELEAQLRAEANLRLGKVRRIAIAVERLMQVREIRRVVRVLDVATLRVEELRQRIPRHITSPDIRRAVRRYGGRVTAAGMGQRRDRRIPHIEDV